MKNGVVEVVAYQETLLIMAVFGIAILVMIWAGFRRWLRYKEQTGRMIAEQMAERAAQYGAHMEGVEARLKAIEETVADSGIRTAAEIDAPRAKARPDAIGKRDEVDAPAGGWKAATPE